MKKESVGKTLFVSTALCAVCSVLVSSASVALRPIQDKNRLLDRQKNILQTAGLFEGGKANAKEISALFKNNIESHVVDFKTDRIDESVDPSTYEPRKAALDSKSNIQLKKDQDLASIGAIAEKGLIYYVLDGDNIDQVILPVHGKGLWSTMYGFISLKDDLRTIQGMTFYEHGETPGLGGEIDNPKWKQKFEGKLAYDKDWNPSIEVIKGQVDNNTSDPEYKVDGLAGATITSRGVSQLLEFWLGRDGYGPFLRSLEIKKEEASVADAPGVDEVITGKGGTDRG